MYQLSTIRRPTTVWISPIVNACIVDGLATALFYPPIWFHPLIITGFAWCFYSLAMGCQRIGRP
jgi:hypothetical protein